MVKLNILDWLALLIVVLGALNWGFIGMLDINVVKEIFSTNPEAERTVYIIQGLAAFYMAYVAFKLTGE